MKKFFLTIAFILSSTSSLFAQKDSTVFKGHFYNDEYKVYLQIDFYNKNIEVPEHALFGNLPGYFGKRMNNFYWLITSSKVISDNNAEFSMVNDYGSEDLKASLKKQSDSTYIFRQESGSTLKVANNKKWLKLPKELIFMKK